MLKKITEKQRIACEKCCYRDKNLDNIVFCPYINRCRKTDRPAEYHVIKAPKGVKYND
ncbi:MAG: hypothetical protein ACI4YB_02100 [Oscillospiraceae bacterium]